MLANAARLWNLEWTDNDDAAADEGAAVADVHNGVLAGAEELEKGDGILNPELPAPGGQKKGSSRMDWNPWWH